MKFRLDYTSINIAILNKLPRIIMDWLNELYIMTSNLFDKSTKRYIVLIRILWENSINTIYYGNEKTKWNLL